jgi:hypothetical protein
MKNKKTQAFSKSFPSVAKQSLKQNMGTGLSLFVSVFLLNIASGVSLTSEVFNKEKTITCEGTYDKPLRDIATDKKNIWWSFGNIIINTDMDGKGGSHIFTAGNV